MPLTKCPSCHQLLRLPDEAAGQTLRCPSCKAAFRVPDSRLPASPPIPPSQPPRAPRPASPPPPTSDPDDPLAFDDRPGPPPDRGDLQRPDVRRAPLLVVLVACANLVVGVVGLACCGCGGMEYLQDMRFAPFDSSSEGVFRQREWETSLKIEAPSFHLFFATDITLRLAFAGLLIASGAGMFALQGWARVLALVYAGASLLSKLVFIACLLVYFLPISARVGADAPFGLIVYVVEYIFTLPYPALVLLLLFLPGVASAFRARGEWKERQWKEKLAERGEPEVPAGPPPVGRMIAAGAMCLVVGAADLLHVAYRLLSFVGGAPFFAAMERRLPGFTLSVSLGVLTGLAVAMGLLVVGAGLLFRGRWARWAAVGLAVFLLLTQPPGIWTQVLSHSPAVEQFRLNSTIDEIPPGFFGGSGPWQNLQTVFLGGLNLALAAALAALMLWPGTSAAFAARRGPRPRE